MRDAKQLGELLALEQIHVVYGGGAKGLMGAIANEVIKHNGAITGIIPHFMVALEWQHPKVKNMILVDTMAERKDLLSKDVDAIVVLPGGLGTFEEALEVLSKKKLGLFFAPIIFLNTNDFYNPLFELLHKSANEKFMRQIHKKLWEVANTPKQVLDLIKTVKPWPQNSIELADMPFEDDEISQLLK